MKLHLRDGTTYTVRRMNATEIRAVWIENAMQFETGRGRHRRMVPSDAIAAVKGVRGWVPYDDCYRARPKVVLAAAWVHPYGAVAT